MTASLRNAIARTRVYAPSSPSGSSNLSESVLVTSTHYSRRKGLRTKSAPRSLADRHATTRGDCGWHHHEEYSQPRLISTFPPSHPARASRSHVIAPEVSGESSDDRGDLSEFPALDSDAFGELVAVVPISNGPEPKKDPSSRYRVPSATDSRYREESREEGEKALTALLQFLSESDTILPDGTTSPAAVNASDPEAGVQEEEGAKGWDGGQAEGNSGTEAAEESPSGREAREDGSGNFGEASRVSFEGDSGRMWGQSGEKTMDAQRLFVGNLPFSIPSSELVEGREGGEGSTRTPHMAPNSPSDPVIL